MNGIVMIGFIMIGVVKIIGLLILKIVGLIESWFNCLNWVDLVKKIMNMINLIVMFVLVIVKNWFKNCCVIIWLLLVSVKFFFDFKILVFFKEFVCKIGFMILLMIVDLWILKN